MSKIKKIKPLHIDLEEEKVKEEKKQYPNYISHIVHKFQSDPCAIKHDDNKMMEFKIIKPDQIFTLDEKYDPTSKIYIRKNGALNIYDTERKGIVNTINDFYGYGFLEGNIIFFQNETLKWFPRNITIFQCPCKSICCDNGKCVVSIQNIYYKCQHNHAGICCNEYVNIQTFQSNCSHKTNRREIIKTADDDRININKYMIYNPITNTLNKFTCDGMPIDKINFGEIIYQNEIYFFNDYTKDYEVNIFYTKDFKDIDQITLKSIRDLQCCCYKIPNILIFRTKEMRIFEYYDIKNNLNVDIGPFIDYYKKNNIFEYYCETKTAFIKEFTYEKNENENECCICLQDIKGHVALIPCGHTQFCEECIRKQKICPLCKKEITNILKIYK